METRKDIKSFDIHLNENYGDKGTESRKKFDEEFETFKIGVLIQEARKRQHLTQGQLAEKVGTTKIIFPELKIMQATFDFQH